MILAGYRAELAWGLAPGTDDAKTGVGAANVGNENGINIAHAVSARAPRTEAP